MRKIASLTLGLSVAFAAGARGQLVGLNHVWTVPGVLNTAGLRTVVACTNAGTAGQTIGVDVYGAAGTYVNGNSLAVAPNATVLFGTDVVTNLSIDVNLSTGIVAKGHARVYGTTSRGLTCSAYIADAASGVPSVSLSVVKKIAQKGD